MQTAATLKKTLIKRPINAKKHIEANCNYRQHIVHTKFFKIKIIAHTYKPTE